MSLSTLPSVCLKIVTASVTNCSISVTCWKADLLYLFRDLSIGYTMLDSLSFLKPSTSSSLKRYAERDESGNLSSLFHTGVRRSLARFVPNPLLVLPASSLLQTSGRFWPGCFDASPGLRGRSHSEREAG